MNSDFDWRKELKKQAIDQPLHFAWAFATTFAPFLAKMLGFPEWAGVLIIFASFTSMVSIVLREWLQWPSSRWWDPWLDWLFFTAGAGTGIATGFAVL